MSEYIEFAVRVPKDEADSFIARFGKGNVRILGFLLGEEVVRCRDCKRFSLDNSDHDYRTGWWCKRWYTDMVKPDGFCAWGERRED